MELTISVDESMFAEVAKNELAQFTYNGGSENET